MNEFHHNESHKNPTGRAEKRSFRCFRGGPSMPEPKLIKRYTNRKLYDTGQSAYITLDQVAGFIKAGTEVRVIDNKTKNDITPATLTQLLYEQDRKARVLPSVDLLMEIIRRGDGSFSGFLRVMGLDQNSPGVQRPLSRELNPTELSL